MKDVSEAKKIAEKIGYPVVTYRAYCWRWRKRYARYSSDEKELETGFRMTEQEAQTAFGNGGLYGEIHRKLRHIEIQIVGDSYGNVIHLGERN
ncbi:ATP-binding protein [Staphylococcus aureus]